ncbi:MAG: segregation/condensation protein A [Endomicrobiia bacterium]|nr:segregation/condensation protein A [Endomicrobiia bacterium]
MTYEVHIPIFEGPLDLLLHIIKKNDMDIQNINISQITGEFSEYVNLMKDLNLDIAGEFLVMAATLLEMKSRCLLPSTDEETEEPQMFSDLKERLSEYQKYRHIATILAGHEEKNRDVFYRVAPKFSTDEYTLDVSLFDLLDTFKRAITVLPDDVKKIVYEEIPIERKIAEILDILREKRFIPFKELLSREKTRMGMVVNFLAVLELIRLGQIIARQKETFGGIRIYLVEYKPEEEFDGVSDGARSTESAAPEGSGEPTLEHKEGESNA